MIPEKGGGSIGSTMLAGKYQLCRVIGKGRTGTVYLAFHRELEEYRAVKAVAKSSLGYEAFRKEALLMKELRHPGIPVIYDIEEDEEYSYLVEEYLQGDSLNSLVSRQGPLTRCTVLRYVIQLCGVVNYLHSAGTEPILHLDVQPKNLLVCHETLKLIDFGQAERLSQANKTRQRFGTVGFAAPEQFSSEKKLDERTDIYAIGGLLFYLATGEYPNQEVSPAMLGLKLWDRETGRILAACLEPKQENRYSSVRQLMEDLEKLQEQSVSSQVVAVYGNEPGIGATHISLALCAHLWDKGIPNLYEECHPSLDLRRLRLNKGKTVDSCGIFNLFGCALKPWYGRQARFIDHHYPVVIQDRGVWKGAENQAAGVQEPKAVFLVVGGKWWNQPPAEDFLSFWRESGILIYNFSDKKIRLKEPEGIRRGQALRAPLFANPFRLEGAAGDWMEQLWKRVDSRKGKVEKEGGKGIAKFGKKTASTDRGNYGGWSWLRCHAFCRFTGKLLGGSRTGKDGSF